jgi:lysophospholipase L1-like esterase
MSAAPEATARPLWALFPVLFTQGLWVRSRTPRLQPASGALEGVQGTGHALNLLALGDSIVVGVGVRDTREAMPSQLAASLADELGCAVHWQARGSNGAATTDLLASLEQADLHAAPDLVVISNGINDVTGLASTRTFSDGKQRLYQALADRFPNAVLAQLGMPPMHLFPALPQPLRGLLGERAAAFDARLARLALQYANLRHFPFTRLPPVEMFASDGYHPNEAGIKAWVEGLAPPMAALLGDKIPS